MVNNTLACFGRLFSVWSVLGRMTCLLPCFISIFCVVYEFQYFCKQFSQAERSQDCFFFFFFLHSFSFLFVFYQWEGEITFEERGKRGECSRAQKKRCVKGALLSLLASVWVHVSYHPIDCGTCKWVSFFQGVLFVE